jgi:hypothetical protein
MNNRQNGRRRGRGGQQARGGQPGSPDRGNRIDNRARGNAAQLLEKYKSLARDAQNQGDRVNTEYYLQFADHYFRVLSESRSRFEEQQQRHRRDDYRDEFGQEGDFEQEGPRGYEQVEAQGDGGWNDGEDERPQPRQQQPIRAERERREPREAREPREPREMRQPRETQPTLNLERETQPTEAAEGSVEAAEPRRERRPRRTRAAGDEGRGKANGNGHAPAAEEPVSERIEVERLPQGFATAAAAPEPETAEEPAPKPRRRVTRRPRGEAATVEA